MKGHLVEDEELDYWPMPMWSNPSNNEWARATLTEATSLEPDEIEVCIAFLTEPAHRFSEWSGQYTAEEIEEIFQQYEAGVYEYWGEITESWARDQNGEAVLDAFMRAARHLGHQDVLAELLDEVGRERAQTTSGKFWTFESSSVDHTRVFRMKRPVPVWPPR